MKYEYYSFADFHIFSKKPEDTTASVLKTLLSENNNFFRSKEDLKNWLAQKPFTYEEQQRIAKTIKRKEHYVENFSSYENQVSHIDANFDILLNDSKVFLNRLNRIEKEPIFRLILKIVLNININYLNNEISYLNEITVHLNFIRKIKNLYNQSWNSHKGKFFLLAHKMLGEYSPNIKQIRYLSIQQRILRDLKKIKEMYSKDELYALLLSVRDKFYIDLLESHPLVLSTYSTEYCEFNSSKDSFNKLKVADLSNNELENFPHVLKDTLSLEYIDLSGNRFSEIPEELFMLTSPKVVIMRDQGYQLSEKSITRYKTKYPNCLMIH